MQLLENVLFMLSAKEEKRHQISFISGILRGIITEEDLDLV